MTAPDSRLPRTVGRYQIIRELGKGAMGRVLLAHDPVLERAVAIKHLRSDLPLVPEQRAQLLERMRQEARACARVSHPNLVALHDMGETPDLGLYLVFEYVEGPTLKERLEHGPLGAEAVANLAREVSTGLRLLHEAGVIHRDIKPDNLILSRTGSKLTDFGIARVPDSTLTGAGNVLGTPAYSSPEAIRNSQFSPRSDQFSLAATLYEALSGRRAFPGDDAVFVATQIANTAPHPIAKLCGVPLAADAVLFKALSKNPQQRFDDCEQFGSALAEALVPTPRTTQPPIPVVLRDLPQPPVRRNRLGSVFSALVLLGAGAWLGTRLFTSSTPDSPAAEPVLPLSAQVERDVPAVAWLSERRKQAGKEEDEELTEDAADEAEPDRPAEAPNAEAPEAQSPDGAGKGETPKPAASAPSRIAPTQSKPRTAKAPRAPNRAP